MKRQYILIIALVLVFLSKSLLAGTWWNEDWKYRRKISFNRENQRFQKSEGGRILVNLQNRAFQDARDVRITDEKGNLLKYKIIWFDEGDLVQIICELGDKESAYVYWGNKKAQKQTKDEIYDPKFGLYLETWEKPEGNLNTWDEVQELFKKSKKIYGRSVRVQVQDRFNRFGPSDNYLSHYYGWLNCPESGEYKFYTASDDASFLLIDDKVVTQWAGRHTAWNGLYGQHSGTVELKKGKHRFDYYHVETSSDQACVAGWRLPSKVNDELEDGETFLIPPRYFGGFVEGYAEGIEILGEKVSADFRMIAVSDLYMTESDALVKIQFKADIVGGEYLEKGWKCSWDFDDGNTGEGEELSHTFLTTGLYTVQMNIIKDKKILLTSKIKLKVLPIWDQASRFNENTARYFWSQIKEYNLAKTSKSGLQNFYAVCDMLRNHQGRLKALRELVRCIDEFKDNEKVLIYLELADLEAYMAKSWENSSKYLNLALKSSQTENSKITVKFKTAELSFKVFDKNKEAFEILQSLEKASEKLTINQKRELYLILGDYKCYMGELDESRKYYESAMKTGNSEKSADELQIADWRMQISNSIRTRYFENSINVVQDWRWSNPVSYFDHDLTLWEIRAYLADDQTEKAEVLVKILIKGQPENVYAGDCLWELGEHFIKYKVWEKARVYLSILIEKYEEHPKYKDAVEIIKNLKK